MINNCLFSGGQPEKPIIELIPTYNNLGGEWNAPKNTGRAIRIISNRIHGSTRASFVTITKNQMFPDATFWGMDISGNYCDGANYLFDGEAQVRGLNIINNIVLNPCNGNGYIIKLTNAVGVNIKDNIISSSDEMVKYSFNAYAVCLNLENDDSVISDVKIINNYFEGHNHYICYKEGEHGKIKGLLVIGNSVQNNTNNPSMGFILTTFSNVELENIIIANNIYNGISDICFSFNVGYKDNKGMTIKNIIVKNNSNMENYIYSLNGSNGIIADNVMIDDYSLSIRKMIYDEDGDLKRRYDLNFINEKLYYDNAIGLYYCHNKELEENYDINKYPLLKIGSLEKRNNMKKIKDGAVYFDTTLNKPIWWIGTK